MQLKTLFLSSKIAESMTAIPALPSISHDIGVRLFCGKGGGRIFACRSKTYTPLILMGVKKQPSCLNSFKQESVMINIQFSHLMREE